MTTASKQGMAAAVFGDLHCSCDGFRSPELPSTLSCSETVCSGCSIYTPLLVSASRLGERSTHFNLAGRFSYLQIHFL